MIMTTTNVGGGGRIAHCIFAIIMYGGLDDVQAHIML